MVHQSSNVMSKQIDVQLIGLRVRENNIQQACFFGFIPHVTQL
jgi:hypothetical protein